jgi:hypothetical protein
MPNLFGQTLDATSYRGKTVRFSVDVQFDVPNDAEHISFGCYTKIAKLHVRDARFQIIHGAETGNAPTSQSKLATADIPYNVMLVPGYEIRREPTNLDFSQSTIETVWQAARSSNEQSR